MEGVGHSLAMGEVTLKPLLEDARRYIYVCYLCYLCEFTVSGLILFVNDSGATPRGHRLARIIAAWC